MKWWQFPAREFLTGWRRVVVGISVASELWWITSPPRGKLSECRTYLVCGFNVNRYDEMYVFNLHLFILKLSLAWRRD